MSRRLLGATGAAILGAAAFGVVTQAYSSYGKWATVPVVMYINPANADVSADAAEAAVQRGMEVWNTQGGSGFRFVYGGRVNDTTTGNDGRSVVIFRNSTEGGGALAATYSWASNGSLVDSDIIFWDGSYTFFAGDSGCSGGVYIEDVGAHEFGHVLGLSHSESSDATMYPTIGWCSQAWRTLASDDIAGVKALYPVQSSTTLVPAAPTGLAAAASGATTVNVSWSDNASNESGYRVQRSTDGASFTTVAQLGTNTRSFNDSGLSGSTTYYYRVAAYNSAGTSAYSNVGSARTSSPVNTAPSVSIANPVNGATYPAGATISFSGSASDQQDGTLTGALTWTSNLEGTLGSGGAFSKALKAGTHVVTARVTDAGGLSGSQQVTVTVGTTATVPSTGLTLSARGYKVKGTPKVDLAWTGASSTSVDVYRNGAKVSAAPGTAYTDTLKKGGGTYQYKVCEAASSNCSSAVAVTF